MLFPESPRVIYSKNPLISVVCQLRFPTILKIDAQLPVDFQEEIREQFPLFRQQTQQISFAQIPPELAKQIKIPPSAVANAYEFSSADGGTTITLTKDFLALATNNYQRWENFKANLAKPIEALEKVYSPAFFTRVGLRYQDLIDRSSLGLKGVGWGQLLEPHIAGVLAWGDVEGSVDVSAVKAELRLQDFNGRVSLQHGLAESEDSKELCYLIDTDFFTNENTSIQNATNVLNSFNKNARELFRWCITEKLHNAMEPRSII